MRSEIEAIANMVLVSLEVGVEFECPFATVLRESFSRCLPGAPHLRGAHTVRYGL